MAKKTRKKAARKKAPSRKKAAARRKTNTVTRRKKAPIRNTALTAVGIGKGSFQKASDLEFTRMGRGTSVYDELFVELKKLKPGQAYMVPVPEDTTPSVIHNRLSAAFKRAKVQEMAPSGYAFLKRTISDHTKIAITLVSTG